VKVNLSGYIDKLIMVLTNNLHLVKITDAKFWSNTGWSFLNASSKDFELCFFTDGATNMFFNDVKIQLKAGDIFFQDNEQSSTCENGNFTFFTVAFSIDSTQNNALYKQVKELISFMNKQINILSTKSIESLYKCIFREHMLLKSFSEINIKFLFIQLLIEISRAFKTKKSSDAYLNQAKYSKIAWETAIYISENLERRLTLSEIGKKQKLNPRYLDKIFKNDTGLTIIQYHQHLKVDKAKKLLRSSTLSIIEISTELNFPSSQYFSHVFKKLSGLTPLQYRKS